MQVAAFVDIDENTVWAAFMKLAPQLDQLQHKNEAIVLDEMHYPDTVRDRFWAKVGNNLIELADSLESHHQVKIQRKFCFIYCSLIYVGSSILARGNTWRAGQYKCCC